MSTLRPEEVQRKAIVAGYGNQPASNPSSVHEDDTCVLAQASADFDFGDWVAVQAISAGYLKIKKPTDDGDVEYLGVVQSHVKSGEWCKVKTCGVTIAKVLAGDDAETGDLLGTTANQVYAKSLEGPMPCARFLKRFAGDDNFAWVDIGGSGSGLTINHHDDDKNSKVTDTTIPALPLTAPLWMVWRVVNITTTGDPDPRLMTCIGGGRLHGDLPWEGWAWGGVIGDIEAMGFGEFGGNSGDGQQGVLGAESRGPSSDHDKNQNRINVRSWAGFNAHDRYGGAAPATPHVVAPIRFTYCPTERKPSWWVPVACDCVQTGGTPITPGAPCGPDLLWWSGTMKRDPIFNPSGKTHTDWQQQWTPQIAAERDCDALLVPEITLNPPSPDCGLLDTNGRSIIQQNRKDLCGGYESVVPFGYVPCPGRLSTVQGLKAMATHISAIWLSIWKFSDAVSKVLGCHDAALLAFKAFFGTKTNGPGNEPAYVSCCPSLWAPPALSVGPDQCAPCQATEAACPAPTPNTP